MRWKQHCAAADSQLRKCPNLSVLNDAAFQLKYDLFRRYTYNKQPICYVALASQKNYCSLYLMGAFWSASQLEQLKTAFKAAGKKLDMGKCCVHFKSPDDLPLEAIGKLISTISSEKWIEMYEQSRLMTKAGQAKMAKQGTPSASKVAAKRVATKRRR